MPLDPEFGSVVFTVTATLRELRQQIETFMSEETDTEFTVTREYLEGISNMLLVSSEMIPGLYEENQTIIDRLKEIEKKVNKLS